MKALVILVAVTCSSAQMMSHFGAPGYYSPSPYPHASPVINPYGYFPGQYVYTPYNLNATYIPPYMINPYYNPYAHAPYAVPQYPYFPPPYALPHQPRTGNTAAEQEEAEEAFGGRNRRDLYAALPYMHNIAKVKDVAGEGEK